MNTERAAYTGWMTLRDRQLFRVLLDGLPAQTRSEVVDALARSERLRHSSLTRPPDEDTRPGRGRRRRES